MSNNSTKSLAQRSEDEMTVHLVDDWFDPIEAGLRDRVRELISVMIEGEKFFDLTVRWKLIRRRCLHNRYFHTLNEVVLALEPRLAEWTRPNATLRRLCALI